MTVAPIMQSVNTHDLLPDEELNSLIIEAQNGNKASRNDVIKHNLRLVIHISKRYKGRGDDEDLFQAGIIGLNRAIDLFKVEKGFKFSTYSYFWIRQSINNEVVNNSKTIRIPAHIHSLLPKITEAEDKLISEQLEINIDSISELIGETKERVRSALESREKFLSLDYENEDEKDLKNIVEQKTFNDPEEYCINEEFKTERMKDIEGALNTLNIDHKNVIILRFGLDGHDKVRTLKEVASIIGLTKERVRQIEKTSLRVLKQAGGRSERRKKIKKYI